MSDHRSPPPGAASCLDRPRQSTQKGGTLIAEDVTDLATHQERICDPDGYRPSECPTCHHHGLHMHERRYRLLLGDPDAVAIPIAIYRCAGCDGTWRILPRFMARHLWRSWRVVEAATGASLPSPSQRRVAPRTLRRWWERLRASACILVQLLTTSGSPVLEAVAHAAGTRATRAALIAGYASGCLSEAAQAGERLANLAALIHRLGPGLRLM